MNPGVSTACLYPLETEKSFDFLGKNGVKYAEIFLNDESEAEYKLINQFKDIKSYYNIKIVSLHSCFSVYDHFMLFSDYKRRLETGIEKYKKLFNATSECGGDFLIFHGNKKDRAVEENKYFNVFHLLQKTAKSFGVSILQENVATAQSSDIDFLVRMQIALKDDAMFTFDIKQAIRSGYDPLKFYEKIKHSIKHIHINDNTDKCDCLLPGKGTFNFKDFFALLNNDGYKNSLIIEVYRKNFFDKNDIIKSYKYLEKTFN